MQDFDSALESRSNAFLAGCILSALSTALLIVWLGMVPSFGNDSVDKADPANQTQMVCVLLIIACGFHASVKHNLKQVWLHWFAAHVFAVAIGHRQVHWFCTASSRERTERDGVVIACILTSLARYHHTDKACVYVKMATCSALCQLRNTLVMYTTGAA